MLVMAPGVTVATSGVLTAVPRIVFILLTGHDVPLPVTVGGAAPVIALTVPAVMLCVMSTRKRCEPCVPLPFVGLSVNDVDPLEPPLEIVAT